jgi:hypothetical protein
MDNPARAAPATQSPGPDLARTANEGRGGLTGSDGA